MATLIDAARATGARVHVVHVSAASVLPLLRGGGRGRGADHRGDLPALPDPGRRGRAGRRDRGEVLPAGARAGPTGRRCGPGCAPARSSCVVSDHSPCPPELKRLDTGDFGAAWGGIASLQLALPLVWTGARRAGAYAARRGAVDGGGTGPAGRAGRQGPDRGRARTRTWSRSRRRRPSWSTRPGCGTGTR